MFNWNFYFKWNSVSLLNMEKLILEKRMRNKIILLLVSLVLINSISAGLNVNNGNVGIGTTSPGTTLEVIGGAHIGDTMSSYVKSTGRLTISGSGGELDLQDRATGTGTYSISDRWVIYNNLDTLRFHRSGDKVVINSVGNVGIGTTNPRAALQIGSGRPILFDGGLGTIKIRAGTGGWATGYQFQGSSGTNRGGLWAYGSADNLIWWNIGSTYNDGTFTVLSGGNVGIGTTSPSQKLDVNGNIIFGGYLYSNQRSNFFLALQSDRNMVLYDNGGAVWASGTGLSDIRLKKNITSIDNALEKIIKLNGIRFNWINESMGNDSQIGVIAQEVEKDFPELILTDPESGNKLVYYNKLTAVLVEAIKELKQEKDTEIAELNFRIENLEYHIGQLEKVC